MQILMMINDEYLDILLDFVTRQLVLLLVRLWFTAGVILLFCIQRNQIQTAYGLPIENRMCIKQTHQIIVNKTLNVRDYSSNVIE